MVRCWIDQITEHDRRMPVGDDLAHLLYARAHLAESLRRTEALITRQLMRRLEARLDER